MFNRMFNIIDKHGRQYTLENLTLINYEDNEKQLILILCQNSIEILSAYISAMNSQHAVMLLSEDINKNLLQNIIEQYMPRWIVGLKRYEGYTLVADKLERNVMNEAIIHPDLALLLSTSGTTGSQKFVRLSYENLRSNAESIIEYLKIDENERVVMNLPLSYSYGMSIVNSHLLAGATVLLTDESVMEKSFWVFIREYKATSMAGVPFTYQMLQRIGLTKMDLPHLKTLTQAGGRLNERIVRHFGEWALANGKCFYVMYGQTEAAPRMSYIPYDKVLEKAGTIGIAVPGGELTIVEEELVYKGPNVMMGYAENLADLAKGDELGGVLHTGDTAVIDEDGYFTITGRMKRFIKLFGLRINLDDVEKRLESELHISLACTGSDDKLIVVIEDEAFLEVVKQKIESLYHLHKTAYKVKVLEIIPRFTNGKINYMTLKESCL